MYLLEQYKSTNTDAKGAAKSTNTDAKCACLSSTKVHILTQKALLVDPDGPLDPALTVIASMFACRMRYAPLPTAEVP